MMAATVYCVGVDPSARKPICSTPAIAPEFAGVSTRVRTVCGGDFWLNALIAAGEPFMITTDSPGFDRLLRVLDKVGA